MWNTELDVVVDDEDENDDSVVVIVAVLVKVVGVGVVGIVSWCYSEDHDGSYGCGEYQYFVLSLRLS